MGSSTETDVLVVGSGAAGLCAALEASAAGARVILLDSESEIGGSSRMSAGIIMGAGTRRQSALGIEDSPESLFHDYMALNQWKVDAAVVHRLAQECGPSVDWLEDQGIEFLDHLYFSGDERVPRCHVPATGDAAVVIDTLYDQCRKRPDLETRLGARVDGLITENDRVVGVSVQGSEIGSRTVVIATGGFGAARELVESHYPKAAAAGDWCWYIGAPGARGDALALAEQADLQTIGHDRGLFLLSPNFGQCIEGAFPGWLVIVNALGRRFFDETAPYSVTEPLARSQPGPLWAIFDTAAKQAAQPEGYGDAKKQSLPVGFLKSNWVEPVLDEMLSAGLVLQADSISDLAKQIGIPAENLEGTIDGYNEGVDAGGDRLFRKPARVMRRIDSPPYYATELRLSVLCLTSMGLRIDPDARVYDKRTRPVPGLYAAGECAGGVLGDIYVGSGNSWANCVTYGRIAGRSAAREVLEAR